MPGLDELNKLHINRSAIGGFAWTTYWSSSEKSSEDAYIKSFHSGANGFLNKHNNFRLTAVKAF
jgi:hypothetical protein